MLPPSLMVFYAGGGRLPEGDCGQVKLLWKPKWWRPSEESIILFKDTLASKSPASLSLVSRPSSCGSTTTTQSQPRKGILKSSSGETRAKVVIVIIIIINIIISLLIMILMIMRMIKKFKVSASSSQCSPLPTDTESTATV